MVENCRYIGGNKVFVFPQSDDRGWAITGSNNLVGFINRNYRQRKNTCQLAHSLAHCLFERGAMPIAAFQEILLDQVGDYLGIGFRGESMAFFDELFL